MPRDEWQEARDKEMGKREAMRLAGCKFNGEAPIRKRKKFKPPAGLKRKPRAVRQIQPPIMVPAAIPKWRFGPLGAGMPALFPCEPYKGRPLPEVPRDFLEWSLLNLRFDSYQRGKIEEFLANPAGSPHRVG